MGLQSAMTTALTGLQAAEATIDVVGNNVANSNTVGFKQSSVLFATQFLQTQSVGSAPSPASGGTNPRQIGLGVRVAEIAPNFTQGTIQVSANPLDLAIQGDGFFIVAGPGGGGQALYTRNGQLKVNSENEIVTLTGHRVLGYGINENFAINTNRLVPLTIPFGGSNVAQETKNVTLVGNLLPNSELVATQPGVIESVVLNDNSVDFPNDLLPADLRAVNAPTIPPGAKAEVGANPGNIGEGTYGYRIVWFDPDALAGNDETPPSVEIGFEAVGNNSSIELTGLPTVSPDPNVYTMKRIYRTNADDPNDLNPDGTQIFRLIADNIPAAQALYTDTAAAGTTELNTDGLGVANYSYFVTYVKPGLESRPNSQSAIIPISSTQNNRIRLDLTNVQPNLEDGFDFIGGTIRIYRSIKDDPGNFYFVDEVAYAENDGPLSYIDNKSDAAIKNNDRLNRHGPSVNNSTPLIHVSMFDGTKYVDLFKEGTLRFTGSKGADGGLELAPKELQITDTTTIFELINFMQDAVGIRTELAGQPQPGGSLTADSRLRFESNAGIHNAVNIPLNAFQITASGSTQVVPLTFSTVQQADGAGSSSEMIVYDSLGMPLTVRLTTVLESTTGGVTTYRWFATSPDNQGGSGVSTAVGTGVVTFGGTGKFVDATNTELSINRQDVAANPLVTVNLDFDQVTALHQGTAGRLQMSSQDGFAAGTLASFSITESGRIKGVYSNGVTRDLGQLRMARFSNSGGLQQVGDNLWAQGVNSGEPLEADPGEAGIGAITSGAVELSNTDIGQNLIELILASTQYRGGTRVITSAQQLLDDLLSLRR